MAMVIVEGCIGCGVCAQECPRAAISLRGEVYEIDPGRCNDCADREAPECADACPEECIVPAGTPDR